MLGLQLIVLVFCAMGIEAEYIYHRKAGGSLKHHKRPATWQEARMRCHLEGTVLASPLNTGLREVLEETSRNDYIFVGFHAIFSKGDFFSIEGLPIEKSALTFQPNNYKNKEDCVAMNSFGVMDVPCDDPLPYLCFKEGVPKTVENGPCGPIENGYKLNNKTGNCYKFHTTARTWSRAFMTCSVERAHLVVINSDLEAQVLTELVEEYPEDSMKDALVQEFIYVGVQDWGERGDWQTIHGQSLAKAGYSRFIHGKPNGSGGCLAMRHDDGLLNNVDCGSIHPFFCEKLPY
ncbi:secretory phospholipase A2 receptor-like [Cydia pomonella]|uniref:secretory phospholipase A2 receptor-like n=1 Tax=Cydia pomonella TaxID=82600 RepID=UPI002ADDDFFE|nr:secretory phospholipase A2 receptor-like [Cydia pomonella]